jgi:plasmid stabilization system protein ParE
MRIRWTPAAAADLQGISDYIKEHHPHCRDPTVRRLHGDIRALKEWPGRGRPGREDVLHPRSLIAPAPYVAVYRVRELM